MQIAEQQPDRSALPGAVRPEEAEDLAFTNSDVERLERSDRCRWFDKRQAEWQRATPETKRALQAYADGVNAYLAGKPKGAIAVEYTILDLAAFAEGPVRR